MQSASGGGGRSLLSSNGKILYRFSSIVTDNDICFDSIDFVLQTAPRSAKCGAASRGSRRCATRLARHAAPDAAASPPARRWRPGRSARAMPTWRPMGTVSSALEFEPLQIEMRISSSMGQFLARSSHLCAEDPWKLGLTCVYLAIWCCCMSNACWSS